jgi:predicted HicB family RNase H-like nuclease
MKISKIKPQRKAEILKDPYCPIFTQLTVRINLRDYIQLEAMAQKQGVTLSAYIRQLLELTPLTKRKGNHKQSNNFKNV